MGRMTNHRVRLDQLLTDRGLAPSRARARDAVVRGCVTVDGAVITKPGAMAGTGAQIVISDPAGGYVSRAALKLIAALDAFQINLAGRCIVDIGASTGGFTQVALERGAEHVTAIDVGHGQLAPSLGADSRVTNLERMNARHLSRNALAHPVEAIVCDVSFISITLALPPVLTFADSGAVAVVLIKPQFEVGRHHIGKGGLVSDASVVTTTVEDLTAWMNDQPGWQVLGTIPSPIVGSDGNKEFVLAARKDRA